MDRHPHDFVLVELMPDVFRAHHRAAADWGSYPTNGSYRQLMPRWQALETIAADPDAYAHLVPFARASFDREEGVPLEARVWQLRAGGSPAFRLPPGVNER